MVVSKKTFVIIDKISIFWYISALLFPIWKQKNQDQEQSEHKIYLC